MFVVPVGLASATGATVAAQVSLFTGAEPATCACRDSTTTSVCEGGWLFGSGIWIGRISARWIRPGTSWRWRGGSAGGWLCGCSTGTAAREDRWGGGRGRLLFLLIFSSATTGGKSEARIASFRISKEMTYCGLPILYELFYSSVQFVFGSVFLTTPCLSFNQFDGCLGVHPGIPMANQKPSSQHEFSSALTKHLLLCPCDLCVHMSLLS